MRSQLVKDAYYGTVARLSYLNFLRYRIRARRHAAPLLLHLGSGLHPIAGFVNIDANPLRRPDLWLDLRLGLPFRDDSVAAAYCCHTLEHFAEPDVRNILREAWRVLKPGCGVRLVTPDLGKAIAAYVAGRIDWFDDFPDSRRSLGGRFTNYLLCRDQHRLMFDFSFMAEILHDAGFIDIVERSPHESALFERSYLASFEYEQPAGYHSLFVEAYKPGAPKAPLVERCQ
jgi:predicted SAM-dependent methyltransferase